MAANQTALNNYLQDTLGFPQALAHALNAQGLDGFDILVNLTDKDIKDMCANVRKPGGTIANPAYDAANPVAGVPPTVPNPGVFRDFPSMRNYFASFVIIAPTCMRHREKLLGMALHAEIH
jgi:hypothetical protein